MIIQLSSFLKWIRSRRLSNRPLGLDNITLIDHGRPSGFCFFLFFYLHDVSCDGIGRDVEMPVSQSLKNAEAFAATSADQEPVLGFDEAEDPGVAFHGRLLASHGRRLLGEQVESFGFDVGDEARVRPRHVRNGPVSGRSRPNSRALEGGRDLDDEPLADPQFDFGRVRHHFDNVAIRRFVAGLNRKSKEKLD